MAQNKAKLTTAGLAAVSAAVILATPIIKGREGNSLVAYPDVGRVWTICNGETRNPDGSPVRPGQTMTQPQCDGMTREQVFEYGKAAYLLLQPQTVPTPVLTALTVFSYNVGTPTLARSSVLRDMKAGRIAEGCDAILAYRFAAHHDCRLDKGKKKGCYGVWTRRLFERGICISGVPIVYDSPGISQSP